MSWVRSLQIAQSLLLTRTYATVLIVNGEFTVFEYGLPEVNVIRSRDQLRHMFAAFTIGEAASATIVGASPERWRFRFRSDPTRADLCTVPIRGYDQFAMPSARLGLGGLYQLVAFSEELFIAAVEEMVRFVRDTYESPEVFDLWFPHAANSEICRVVARRLGLGNRVYGKTFESCGNLISASIPAAMAQAADDGRLKRGDHIVLCPASAGMSLALVDGRY